MLENFRVSRGAGLGRYRFSQIFSGLEECRELWRVYGGKEKFHRNLSRTKVRVSKNPKIFFIDVKRKCVVINQKYLQKTDRRTLFLDCLHELVHIKQLRDGRNLFDKRYEYVDRPTEIQAYKVTMPVAKRLNMSRKQIINYLKVPWVSREQHARLVRNVIGE